MNFAIFPGNNIAYKKQIEIELYSCVLALQLQNLRILRDALTDIGNGQLVKKYVYKLKQIKIEVSIFMDVLTTSNPLNHSGESLMHKISGLIDTLRNTEFIDHSTDNKNSLWNLMEDSQALLSLCNLISIRKLGNREGETNDSSKTNF